MVYEAGGVIAGHLDTRAWALTHKLWVSQGTLASLDGYHKRAKVVYDDGEEEWLALPNHAFRWLAPRARSAGCTEPLKRALCSLGAQGESLLPAYLSVTQQDSLTTLLSAIRILHGVAGTDEAWGMRMTSARTQSLSSQACGRVCLVPATIA